MIEVRIQAKRDNNAEITINLRQDDYYSPPSSFAGSSSIYLASTLTIEMLCQTLTNKILALSPIYENAVESGKDIYLEIIPSSCLGDEIPLGGLESLVASLQDKQLVVKQVMMKNLYTNEFEDIGPGLGLAPAETRINGFINVINQAEKFNFFEQLRGIGLSFFEGAPTADDISSAAPLTPSNKQ